MAPPAIWWLRRLRAMSPGEVVHRTARLVRQPFELLAMAAGTYARPSPEIAAHLAAWRGPRVFYFPPELAAAPLAPAARRHADAICAGRRHVLGLGEVTVPAEPWHHEPRTGGTWPRGLGAGALRTAPAGFDARLTWELNRGHEWVVLARAYAATGEPRYHAELARQLASWQRSNPIGRGINWASAMEAAIRIHSLAWTAGFLRSSGRELLPAIARAIFAHASFVADHLSHGSSANNHLVVELSGLIAAARSLGHPALAARWYAPALAQLERAVAAQVLPDGVHAEMASHYHAFVLEALLLVAWLERAHGAPLHALERRLHAMADYLRALTCDGGAVLGSGDSDDGRILPWFDDRHEAQLIAATAALDAPPGPSVARVPGRDEGAFWMTGGRDLPAFSAEPCSRAFAASGQVVLRSRRLHAVFDAGPFGFGRLAAHAHCDGLAVAVAIDGRPVIVDRGTYRYNGDAAARARFRGTAAHNTLQLGAREQATSGGPFLWSRTPTTIQEGCELAGDRDRAVASHDGFAPARHRRELTRDGETLTVRDTILGPRDDAPAVVRFHFAPGIEIARDGARLAAASGGAPIATLWTDARHVRVIEIKHSARYAALEPATTVECELAADRLTSILTPAS